MSSGIKKILYATDMGEHMRPVFRLAIDMAKAHKAKIIMLHVIEPLSSGAIVTIDMYMPNFNAKEILQDGMKKTLKKMQKRLKKFCEDEQIKNPSDCEIVSKVKVVNGHSAESIVHQAEQLEVDLIVVGTHTSPRMSSKILGSTARNITQISRVPVVVVPVYE